MKLRQNFLWIFEEIIYWQPNKLEFFSNASRSRELKNTWWCWESSKVLKTIATIPCARKCIRKLGMAHLVAKLITLEERKTLLGELNLASILDCNLQSNKTSKCRECRDQTIAHIHHNKTWQTKLWKMC